MATKHTPGPWRVGKWGGSIISDSEENLNVRGATGAEAVDYYGGNLIAESVSSGNAERIIACVNAFEGIPDPTSFMEVVKTLELDHADRLKDQNARLKDALEGLLDSFGHETPGGYTNRQIDAVNDAQEVLAELRLAQKGGSDEAH